MCSHPFLLLYQGSHSRRIARDSLRNYKNHAYIPGQKLAFTAHSRFFTLKMSVFNLEYTIAQLTPLKGTLPILQGSKLSNNFKLRPK